MARQERAIRTRAELLAAAAVEFDTFGYLSTTIDGVAERARVTRGSAYYHFASKAQMASCPVTEQYARWGHFIDDRRDAGFRGIELVMLLAHDLAISFRDDVASRAAIRLIKERAHIEAELPTPFDGWIAAVRQLLVEARDLRQVSGDLDVDMAAWTVIAAFFGIQEIADQFEQRQNICLRLDNFWLHLLPGLGVADACALLQKVISAGRAVVAGRLGEPAGAAPGL